MFRRVIGFVFFLVLVGTLIGAVIATGFHAIAGLGRWVVVGLTVLVILGFVFGARRVLGRTWAPVGELIDATQRLGGGDTGVRVADRGPGPFAAVAGSFNRMAQRLEEEDERRRRLFADIGHELRTPMTVIRGEIEAVIDGVHPPDSLANVIDEVDLMDRLLDDLRVLGLAEAGSLRLEAEPTNMGHLVEEVFNSYSRRAVTQLVTLEVETDAGLPEVAVDPYRMHQVISNLVSNALNQMPHGGRLKASILESSASIVIDITDTGPGIPEDQREQIFDRFTRSGDSSGTGLGLSISRDLVTAHRGTLTATNSPHGGAVFRVTIPVHPTGQ